MTIRGLDIGGFDGTGIVLTGSFDVVVGDVIGLDLAGNSLPNAGDGILVTGDSDTIGGLVSIGGIITFSSGGGNDQVIVANNNIAGIEFSGANAAHDLVEGSYVGVNTLGAAAGNGQDGILIDNGAGDDTIGGTIAGAANVISGNLLNGIEITGGPGRNFVVDDLIGVNPSQTKSLGNIDAGVFINGAANNSITGNVVSGSLTNSGVAILGPNASNNLLSKNFIGTDSTKTKAFGNAQDAVFIDNASSNSITGNFVLANGLHGVELAGGATLNTVDQNFIGVPAAGSAIANLGNQDNGVHIDGNSSNNLIDNNVIAHNKLAGVFVGSGTGDAILSNSIYANGQLGIDLAPVGVNPNIQGGPGVGPNDLQNYPVLQEVSSNAQGVAIVGSLNSTPNTTFTLQFFADAGDPSGFGQGQVYLGQTTVATDAAGNANFSATVTTQVPAGYVVSATATDPNNNTSEFSAHVLPGPTFIVVNTNSSGPGSLLQAILNVNASPSFHTIVFAIPGTGPFVIQPTAALPAIVVPTTIDATTEFGYQPGAPNVILDGYLAGANTDGLTFKAAGIALAGLVVQHFADSGVHIEAPNAVLFSDRLLNSVVNGVFIDHAPNAVIAGANTISGNANNGVEILASPNTILYGSRISGNGIDGVFVQDSMGVKVGGAGRSGQRHRSEQIGRRANLQLDRRLRRDVRPGRRKLRRHRPERRDRPRESSRRDFHQRHRGRLDRRHGRGRGQRRQRQSSLRHHRQRTGREVRHPRRQPHRPRPRRNRARSATRRPASSSMDRPTSSSAAPRRLIATSFPATAPPGFNSSARERPETSSTETSSVPIRQVKRACPTRWAASSSTTLPATPSALRFQAAAT